MTHVTVIKQPRYYRHASCGDVIGGCQGFFGSVDVTLRRTLMTSVESAPIRASKAEFK